MPKFESPSGLRGGPEDDGLPPINPQFKPPKGHLNRNDAEAHKKNVQTKRYAPIFFFFAQRSLARSDSACHGHGCTAHCALCAVHASIDWGSPRNHDVRVLRVQIPGVPHAAGDGDSARATHLLPCQAGGDVARPKATFSPGVPATTTIQDIWMSRPSYV